MDCQHVLEILEVARPDSGDRDESELTAAAAHLDECARCAEVFAVTQTLDRRIGRVVRDVEVPAGLQERLLAATMAVDPASPSVTVTRHQKPADSPRTNRRKWLGRVTAAACCLSVGIGLWFFLRPSVVAYSVDELRQFAADTDFDSLPDFSGRFRALLPQDGDWQTPYLQLAKRAGGIPTNATEHQAAIYSFRVPVSRTEYVPGLLLVIPARSVKMPPSATTFNAAVADQKYIWSASGTEYETVAWTRDGLVYVVAVGAGAGALESLQHAIEFTPA